MAISFNFTPKNPDSISPVKEMLNKCADCTHYCTLSELLVQCHSNNNFGFKNKQTIVDNCNFYNKYNKTKRDVFILFVLINVTEAGYTYVDSGLGLSITTEGKDQDVISNLKSNKPLIEDAHNRLVNYYKKDVWFTPVIIAERINNNKWYSVSTILSKPEINFIVNKLNEDSSSAV